ncbi:hypothetical protein O974_11955, partial [Mycobacterium avium 11-0986]
AGFRRVGAPHQRLVRRFLDAVAAGDKFAAAQALSSTAAITLGDRDPIELAELAEQAAGAGLTKMNSAGPAVAVSLHSGHGRAIMFADVAWRANAINRIRYFPA